MKLYVWRGPGVLKNYSSGLVVIVAETPVHAWAKLLAADEPAWWQLRLGHQFITEHREYHASYIDDEDRAPRPGAPYEPTEYDLNSTIPPFILWGGE